MKIRYILCGFGDGNSFLHLAVRTENADIVKFLISKGAGAAIEISEKGCQDSR
jgi:ankyrin repeat protein